MRLRQIIMQMQKEAIEKVSALMEKIDSWLANYCRANDHFPATDVEATAASQRLKRLMPANPFNPAVAQRPEETRDTPASYDERVNINVVVDVGLDVDSLKAFQDTPPDSWQAPAGTITIISNGYNLAAVWAAGADQRPIRDLETGKVRILTVHCRH